MDIIDIKKKAIELAKETHENKYSTLHFNERQIKRDWDSYIEEPLMIAVNHIIKQFTDE